jgi:hypothetical protein
VEVAAVEVAVRVARVLAVQARERVEAQQAVQVRLPPPEEHIRDRASEALVKEEDQRTRAGRAIRLTQQAGRFRGGLRRKIRLQHLERIGSIRARRRGTIC